MLKKLYYKIFKRYERLEMRFLSYSEGDALIIENANKVDHLQWSIAKEEDYNTSYGYVYLERKIRITK